VRLLTKIQLTLWYQRVTMVVVYCSAEKAKLQL